VKELSSPKEDDTVPFPKPVEIKLADVLFFAIRKNLMLFKDLGDKHVHYSVFFRGSLIDFHKTLEDQDRHIPMVEIEFDWQSLMRRAIEEIRADWRSIFNIVRTNDPRWEDLEVDFIPVQVLMDLLSPVIKRVRWNVDAKFLEKLDSSLGYSRLGGLSNCGMIIGTGLGYLAISNGTECFLFDIDKMSKIVEKSFELSIRKIRLSHFTPSSIFRYVRIRLPILINGAIRYLRNLFRGDSYQSTCRAPSYFARCERAHDRWIYPSLGGYRGQWRRSDWPSYSPLVFSET